MTDRGRILVVEDDAAVAELLRDLLKAEGFSCEWVTSDGAAHDALRRPPAPSALILDINLGRGTTGFDIARSARRLHQTIPVIYMSGAVNERSFMTFGVPQSQFLAKPFGLQDLQVALRNAIADSDA